MAGRVKMVLPISPVRTSAALPANSACNAMMLIMLSITGMMEVAFRTTPIRKGSKSFFIFKPRRNNSGKMKPFPVENLEF